MWALFGVSETDYAHFCPVDVDDSVSIFGVVDPVGVEYSVLPVGLFFGGCVDMGSASHADSDFVVGVKTFCGYSGCSRVFSDFACGRFGLASGRSGRSCRRSGLSWHLRLLGGSLEWTVE